ncbi:MAG: transcriptional antiterminator, Rof [Candidatus Igneacidithiobacillus chanchocoensis]
MEEGYTPVSCALHSELELSVLRGTRCRLRLLDGRRWQGWAVDVWSAMGREWLLWKMDGARAGELLCLDLLIIEEINEAPYALG